MGPYLLIALACALMGGLPLVVNRKLVAAAWTAGALTLVGWGVFALFAVGVYGPFWGAVGLWALVALFVGGVVTSIATSEYDINVRPFLFAGGLAALMVVVAIATGGVFRAKDYAGMLGDVEVRTWTEDVQPKDPRHVRIVSADYAFYRAQKALGEAGAIGSQFSLDWDRTTIQVLRGEQVYCLPLDFAAFSVWSSSEGVPAFVIVSAEDPSRPARIVSLPAGREMRFTPGAYFGRDLVRHMRMNGRIGVGLTDISLEVDDDERPYWVVTEYRPTIGWSAPRVTGVTIVDPHSGEMTRSTPDQVPAWVDRVTPGSFVEKYLTWQGKYASGWRNSWWGKKGLTVPEDPLLVYGQDGQPQWAVAITSASRADDSLVGLVYVNARTGKAVRYDVHGGGTEDAAIRAVDKHQDVQFKRLRSTDPQLYNLDGTMVYVLSLQNENGAFMGVALVAANDVQVVGVGDTMAEALRSFEAALAGIAQNDALSRESVVATLEGVVDRFAAEVSGGNTTYLMHVKGQPHLFTTGSGTSPKLAVTRVGDRVRIEFVSSTRDVLPMRGFDNLSLTLSESADQQAVRRSTATTAQVEAPTLAR